MAELKKGDRAPSFSLIDQDGNQVRLKAAAVLPYSTVTLLARLRGWSTSLPRKRAV
jgi:hypothetical protein